MKVNIENKQNLVRDTHTMAILNTDKSAINKDQLFKAGQERNNKVDFTINKVTQDVDSMKQELQDLRKEMREIFTLIRDRSH